MDKEYCILCGKTFAEHFPTKESIDNFLSSVFPSEESKSLFKRMVITHLKRASYLLEKILEEKKDGHYGFYKEDYDAISSAKNSLDNLRYEWENR